MCNGSPCTTANPLYIKDFLQATANNNQCNPSAMVQTVGHYVGTGQNDVLYPYWTIVKYAGILQDKMFAPAPSYSKVTHLFMVSGWSAKCNPLPCAENYDGLNDPIISPYKWNEVTNVFRNHVPYVTWAYFLGENWNYNCSQCKTNALACITASDGVLDLWNPLPNFKTVIDAGETNAVQPLWNFLNDVNQATDSYVPKVSWVVPGIKVSEHDMGGDLRHGQAYTTMLIQQIMKNTALWNSSVIFLSWDDWGGYYDHVRPPRDANGKLMFGIRVPGLTISPYIHTVNQVDHQQLSFDSYLKFVEDLFADGQRIGNPEGRDAAAAAGDLLEEFDFNRTPITPPTNVTNLSCQVM